MAKAAVVPIEVLAWRPAEFAEAIGVSRAKAYEMIASGEVPSITLGGCKRVPVEAAKALIAKQLEEQAAAIAEAR